MGDIVPVPFGLLNMVLFGAGLERWKIGSMGLGHGLDNKVFIG